MDNLKKIVYFQSSLLNRTLLLSILMTFILVLPLDTRAQPGGLDDDPGTSVPIDGGVSILLGAGIFYGARRRKVRNSCKSVQVKDRPVI